jgi:hypothetical protein
LINAAGDSLDQARVNIEDWYNSQMDRVAGWYKRKSQIIVLILGIVIAIAVNADTIAIIKSLSTDAALREALVSIAQEYARSEGDPTSPPTPNQASDIEACRQDQASPECRIERNLAQIRQLGLPLGWEFANPRSVPPLSNIPAWLFKICGWLITAFAISLGAPFWFDLLNKFTVIRSTVKPTEKSPEEKSKD